MLASLVSLVLLAAPPTLGMPRCETLSGRVQLTPGHNSGAPVACVAPHLATTLFFDSEVASLEFPDRERFAAPRNVERLGGEVSFMPLESNEAGQRFPVRVRFADGKSPESVTLWLVFHPAVATRQVIVAREVRSADEVVAENQQLRAENEKLREAARCPQPTGGAPEGLVGALFHGLLGKGEVGHTNLDRELQPLGAGPLLVQNVEIVRTDSAAALSVEVQNGSDAELTIAGAALTSSTELKSSATVWQQAPIPPGDWGHVYLQLPMTPEQARGVFTLALWSADKRVVKVGNITFP